MKINITSKQLDAELPDLLRVADEFRGAGLRGAARYARARGAADLRELARIVARDGQESSVALTKASTAIVGVQRAAQLRDDITSISKNPKADPDTVAAGRVYAPGSVSLKGMRVALANDAGAPIAEARVEDTGHYTVVMPRAEFEKALAATRLLTFSLFDANRKLLRDLRVQPRPGVAQILVVNFQLQAAASTVPGPAAPSPVTPSPVNPTPAGRPVLPTGVVQDAPVEEPPTKRAAPKAAKRKPKQGEK